MTYKVITTIVIGPLDDRTYGGRSAFTHLGFGESCTIVHCITSQPANISWIVLYWHFRQPPTGWMKFERGTFRPPVRWRRASGMGPFDSPSTGSYLLPIDTCGLSLTMFELFGWIQKRFRPSVRPSDGNTMTNAVLAPTASSSGKNSSYMRNKT